MPVGASAIDRRRGLPADYESWPLGSPPAGSTSSSAPKPGTGPSIRNISIVRSGSMWAWLRNASTLTPGELLDHRAVPLFHHSLKVAAHVEHAAWLASLHHRALDRGEPVAEHTHDQVVENVGLGLDRSAAVVLTHQGDDPIRDLREQPAADQRQRPLLRVAGGHVLPPDASPCAVVTDASDTGPTGPDRGRAPTSHSTSSYRRALPVATRPKGSKF